MPLSPEQEIAVNANGHVVVTACPGSGKTRVLTHRVLRGLSELIGNKQRVVALTFTNRAADEIQHRLDSLDVRTDCLWTGTIHSFALEWIVRPYAPYSPFLKFGFTVADEHYTHQALEEAKEVHQAKQYLAVQTSWPRNGKNPNKDVAAKVFQTYKDRLRSERLLDYDDVLFAAYTLLAENPEICETLSKIMPLICVDEVQDIQDMQYAILSKIVNGVNAKNALFFVGDENQSIYESLGALTKSPSEIAAEFNLSDIQHLNLSENYRSTQRVVDYFTLFRPNTGKINSVASYADESGEIIFYDQSVTRQALPKFIAELIENTLKSGVSASEICVIAPWWNHVIPLARSLLTYLPDVDFDAPGLSPLHSNRDDVWFKLARLFLTSARHGHDRTRYRWANDFVGSFERLADVELPEVLRDSRGLLRLVNSIESTEESGIPFLKEVFSKFLNYLKIDIDLHPPLKVSHTVFFEKAEARVKASENGMPTTVVALRKLFRSPSGVVVNTCHGVKGEEYHTVIALGMLHGFVPHWDVIINGTQTEAEDQASKLLYVVCSRAKKNLFLIAESGRSTRSGKPYETTNQLREVEFAYDF